MFDYKKIVYAIDPSDSTLEYLKEVVEYADRKAAQLHIVCVHKTIFDYGYGAGVTQQTPNQIVKNSLKEKFDSLTHVFAQKDQVSCKLIESDSVADGIIDYVSKLGVDLLVLNARDHGALGRMGSVASKISNHAPCDVVLLKNVQKSI